jgi:hypothetical protein
MAIHNYRNLDDLWGGARGIIVGWGTMLQARKVASSSPDEATGFFNLPNPSSLTMALGLTQPLTEMSTRNIPGGKGQPARRGWQPHRHLWPNFLVNVGASTSHNPVGLHGLLQG